MLFSERLQVAVAGRDDARVERRLAFAAHGVEGVTPGIRWGGAVQWLLVAGALLAQVAVRRGRRGAPLSRTARLQVTPRSAATRDVVAAMSTALGELSDVVAEMVRRA